MRQRGCKETGLNLVSNGGGEEDHVRGLMWNLFFLSYVFYPFARDVVVAHVRFYWYEKDAISTGNSPATGNL